MARSKELLMRSVFRVLMATCLAVCLLAGLTGCSMVSKGSGPNGTLTAEEFAAAVVQSERDVRSASGIATTVVMLSLDEKDRPEFGSHAYAAATSVYKVADSGLLDVTELDALARSLVDKAGVRNKQLVGYLITSILQEIKDRVGQLKLGDDQKTTLVRALVRGAAAGVQGATVAYKPPGPASAEAWRGDHGFAMAFRLERCRFGA